MADTLAKADALQTENKFQEQIDLLEPVVKSGSTNVEILWRLARAYYQLGCHTEGDARLKLYEKGYEYAQQAVKADDNHFAGHKWCGILLGGLGEHKATKDRIANAFTIKDFFTRALEISPNDATLLHAMGKWSFTVATVSWMERQAASLLFATPPSSSYEESLTYLLKCDEIATTNLLFAAVKTQNCLLVAQTYEAMKKIPEAKEWYQKCIDSGGKTKPEIDSVNTAKVKLTTVGQSTGYFW